SSSLRRAGSLAMQNLTASNAHHIAQKEFHCGNDAARRFAIALMPGTSRQHASGVRGTQDRGPTFGALDLLARTAVPFLPMPRTPLLSAIQQMFRDVRVARATGVPLGEIPERRRALLLDRRQFLQGAAAAAGALAIGLPRRAVAADKN